MRAVDPPRQPAANGRRPLGALKRRARAAVVRAAQPIVRPIMTRLVAVAERADAAQATADRVSLDLATHAGVPPAPDALEINQQLLKSEVRQVKELLATLGDAIAPAAGIDGVPARFAELRDRVTSIDRRVRALIATSESGALPAATPARAEQPSTAATDRFDYAGFERRFRGDPAEVVALLEARYADLLAASPPVLDIGCGRAELVELLVARGVAAYGVDLDANLAADARARGLDVRHEDALAHLRSLPPASLGSIIATHVVEHLELDDLLELLELAADRLRPGGVFVAETPNPATLVVLGNSYILDPTHIRPLHPSLLAFLCESSGFQGVELRFFAPAEDYRLPLVEDPHAPPWVAQLNEGFRRLNDVLFGPQEYAVVATTPRSSSFPEESPKQP